MDRSFKKSLASGIGALICVALLITLGTALPSVQAAPAGFVAPCGSLFCLNGQVFNVAGTNNHYLGWGTQAEVDQVFSDAQALGLNVVRTIMHSVRGSLDSTQMNQGTMPLKWNWNSTADSSNMGMNGVYIMYWDTASQKMVWNDNTTDGLGRWDYVIWKAKQLGLKLDISLLDFWQWAGGVQQIDANFKGGNYDMSNASDRYTFFFSDSRTQQFYKDWVNHVLNRVNTLTGIKYKDEPTIFAWDLMNEPEISGTGLGVSWISQMSAYVKSIDPNHMVASGNEGFADGHAGSNPQLEMNIPTIDFATWHTYPTYHNITPQDVVNLIDSNCQIAANGHKPVILQEFGYPASNGDEVGVYQSWVNAIYSNANCAGWMFWRLTAHEQDGQYPPDNGEHFDVHNDGGAAAQVFKNAAQQLTTRGGVLATSTPLPTNTPVPTSTPIPTNTPLPTSTPIPTVAPTSTPVGLTGETFYKGINFNGSAVTVQGRNWLSYSSALGQGLTVSGALTNTKALTPNPGTDAPTTSMLNTMIYAASDPGLMVINQTVPNGTYHFYLWTLENVKGNSRRWNVLAEGVSVATNLGDLGMNQWRRYGPYTVMVADGKLTLNLVGVTGRPMIMGLEIYSYR